MKYKCKKCSSEFDDDLLKVSSSSLLTTLLLLYCPYCLHGDMELTEQSKLKLVRKAKIIKIENDQQT